MKNRILMLLVAGAMGVALLGAGGCCHMARHHGGSSCCQKCSCCEDAQCGRCPNYGSQSGAVPLCPNAPAGCPKMEQSK